MCPTIIKYQASITFDTKPAANGTLAVPQINHYEVTVFHDQFQYTPTLTVFTELETKPKQAPAPASSNK